MSDSFEWPTPPHFEGISTTASGAREPVVMVLTDGRRLTGNLSRFDPAAAVLDFHVENAAANQSLGFPCSRVYV